MLLAVHQTVGEMSFLARFRIATMQYHQRVVAILAADFGF